MTSVAVSDAQITDADRGATVTATITFSEAMDPSSTPVIANNAGSTLTNPTNGHWVDATHYAVDYTVADANVTLADVTFDVSGSKDVAGNTQVAATGVSSGTAIDTVHDPNDHDDQATGGGLFGEIWRGTPGPDQIDPGNQAQLIYGGAGNDTIVGGNSGTGETIYGGSGNDTISGNNGVDSLYGGSGNDIIDGGEGKDTIIGGFGADTLTGGTGSDTFKYLSLADSGDHITDFDTNGDVLEFTVTAGRFVIGDGDTKVENVREGNKTAINLAGTEVGIKTDAAVTTATVQSTIDGYTNITTGALFVFYNSTVGHAQVYYDPNPSIAGGAILVADLDNLTTLASITDTFSAADFAFGTALAPAGISGQPINLGLTAAPANQGQTATVVIGNVPADWALNGGTQLPDGSWTSSDDRRQLAHDHAADRFSRGGAPRRDRVLGAAGRVVNDHDLRRQCRSLRARVADLRLVGRRLPHRIERPGPVRVLSANRQ